MFTFIICLLFILAGLLGLIIALQLARLCSRKHISIQKLCEGLHSKLWMTAGLGLFFFTLYGLLIYLFSHWFVGDVRQSLFKSMLDHPIFFIYAGLSLFVFISLSILVVRHIIKRIYTHHSSK